MQDVYTDYHGCKIETGFAGLTEEHIEVAISESARQKIPLRESVLKLGIVSEHQLLSAAAEKTGLELVDLSADNIDPAGLQTVTANIATHYHIIPFKTNGEAVLIATCNPFNPDLKSELELILDLQGRIKFVLATSDAIKKAIRKCYGIGADTVEQMISPEEANSKIVSSADLADETKAREASVIKLVNQILADAISDGATDIHFEPYENDLRVRYRTDGLLHDSGIPATLRHFKDGITSRIKIISGLDIAEKRLPQDGRTQVNLAGRKFDLRISVLPTRHGEAVNIRILPHGSLFSDLPSLGMPQRDVEKLTSLISKPHGIILVTGPTGSGKTTTLYACMNLLNQVDRKILTIEDPVEYDMPGLVQMQVQPEISFTFAKALRSMLRHDPDIMLVGEIRDLETAETAIRTALTGHLVFSTLHTNSAAAAITRLLDMGIEPYLVASSVEAILAQRLVRVICPNCKTPAESSAEIVKAIKVLSGSDKLPPTYRGRGCAKCRFTGYHGRTVITELLIISDTIRDLTIDRRHAPDIDAQARKEGMTTLFQTGLEKSHSGITSYEEVLRVTKGTIL